MPGLVFSARALATTTYLPAGTSRCATVVSHGADELPRLLRIEGITTGSSCQVESASVPLAEAPSFPSLAALARPVTRFSRASGAVRARTSAFDALVGPL